MKFDLVSDLHVDMQEALPNLRPKSDILVIAGDTSNHWPITQAYLHRISPLYKKIIFVLGNHEYYGDEKSKMQPIEVVNHIIQLGLPDNVVFLHEGEPFHFHEEKYLFLGLTGWYDFNYPGRHPSYQKKDWLKGMNDSRYINFSDKSPGDKNTRDPEKHAQKHARLLAAQVSTANMFYQELYPEREIIVITHTIPIVSGCVSPDHPWAYLNGSFYNSFMFNVWKADKHHLIKAWCFGHTHFPCYRYENNIHFYCNPRGYDFEQWKRREYEALQIDTEAK